MAVADVVKLSQQIAARDEARLAEIAARLVEGDEAGALRLMRAFLGVGGDAEGHRAAARLDGGPGRT